MPRRKLTKPTTQMDKFIRMEARGESYADILREVFDVDATTASAEEKHRIDCKLSRWRRYPFYDEVWKDEVKKASYAMTAKAVRKINSQIDNENDWLANKAANDALNFARPHVFGDEERNVTVKIEGMPDLGSPDQEDG